jgi:hypothetical protein
MLYTYIKTLSLINSLYLSEAMTRNDFEEEEKDILERYFIDKAKVQ